MSVKKAVKKKIRQYLDERRQRHKFEKEYKDAREHLVRLPQPELTKEDIEEIDRYWSTYGIKFKDYGWFQWYYGITGIKSPEFIPNDVYYNMVVPYYNDKVFVKPYRDKNLFEMFLPDVSFPVAVFKKIDGCFYDKDGRFISSESSEEVLKLLLSQKQVIVKNTQLTGCGRNVKKYSINSRDDAENLLKEWDCENLIVQEVIQQHGFFKMFNDSSVNIMRIYSWYHDGKVDILAPVLRFGMPGFATDVCFIDGEEIVRLVGITPDGYLRKETVAFNGKKQKLSEVVENTGERVPCWDEILEMIRNNAPKLKHINLIGWDVTVTADEKPVVIEYNINRPSPYSSQMTDGPMFENVTDQVLGFLRDKANQEKYIPKWMRVK